MPNNDKSSLLIMDLQNGIASRFAEEDLIPFQKAIEAARKNDIRVIYVRIAFREGYPELNPRNSMAARISQYGGMSTADVATQIHESVKPEPGEPIVTKLRVSAFSGSDLEIILRSLQIDTLILTGIATSGVVLSTLREAADRDYKLKVLADACLDGDPEVHRVLVEKVFPRQAEVLTTEAWIHSLGAH
ncbi:cysteine hydrolase [Paenibacillus chondroitinus]|uniref:Cysteine hydrolase n=1 Tax=Paenibacillus chondroitinus TaxID=59842 RepID=A0ABU6DHM1_9BACL|nr:MULTISPECIES: cysteine hydrolase [Paenibacillus]MCY9659308.1 cysteine hydrolase [Paenibacillus anseongense]MEB4796356.1 cysteine hydrolase [Paenibacillus chondroitinus]